MLVQSSESGANPFCYLPYWGQGTKGPSGGNGVRSGDTEDLEINGWAGGWAVVCERSRKYVMRVTIYLGLGRGQGNAG